MQPITTQLSAIVSQERLKMPEILIITLKGWIRCTNKHLTDNWKVNKQTVSWPCMSCSCLPGRVCRGHRSDREGWGGEGGSIFQDCCGSSRKVLGSACTTGPAPPDISDTETGSPYPGPSPHSPSDSSSTCAPEAKTRQSFASIHYHAPSHII